MEGCTPNMGVNLWSESPLYENPKVFIQMDPDKSTSQRQGRLREEGSEESLCANVRGDEQKPHTRLSLRANWHNTTKPTGLGDRVNAAFAHGKFTYLSLHTYPPCFTPARTYFCRSFRASATVLAAKNVVGGSPLLSRVNCICDSPIFPLYWKVLVPSVESMFVRK